MKETNPGREAYQRTAFADALAALRDLVNAREVFVWHGLPGVPTLHSALAHALHHIGAEPLERMPQQEDDEEALAEALQGVGVMYRKVDLAPGWHRAAMGTMLLRGEDGEYRILLPSRGGYDLYDYRRQTRTRVGRAQAAALRGTVYVLYPPLPPGRLTGRDLLRFFLRQLSWGDAIAVIMATLAITLLGLIMPKAIQVLYTTIIPGEYADVLAPLLLLLCCIPVSLLLLRVVRGVYVQRVSSRLSLFSYAAVMGRLLQLPVSFFREYDPGELSKRVTASTQLSGTMADTVLTTGISGLLSLIYLAQIASFARAFLLPAAAVAAVSIGISAMAVVREGRHAARLSRDSIVLTGELYDYLSDIQKIKVSGVERLVFANWTNTYIKAAAHRYVRPFLLRMGAALSEAVMAVGMLAIYLIAAGKGVGLADFVAFTASFGMLMGALGSMVAVVQNVAQIAPDFRSAMPLFQAVPEKVPTRRGVQTVQGRLRLEHVSFGYAPELPTILDDLSLDIAEGEYLGIVGRTGCGKSTLLRLLLGFERPVRGTVYFDENDLGSVDLQSFRRHLGVVLQSGSLIAGTILENITLAAPWLSEEDAWEAARIACIDGDIRRLPMGMRTLISAKSSGISGGQKQRIMIARAVAANPSVLLMDEATSSLDNETQAEIAATLDGLRCTRVVVAHRLSTVERCDRIVVLDGGRIAEEGTYRQLMERDGVFAELVRRQQVD